MTAPAALGGAPAGGLTIWLTGLSGAGKSTIAERLARELRDRGRGVEILDGDEVRENLSPGLGFSKEDRDTNIRRIGYVAGLLTRNGVFVIVAAISPYRAVRDEVGVHIGHFFEVHVDCSLSELTRRDVKGLYARAISGEIKNFTGVSDPYEAPLAPDVRVDSGTEDPEASVRSILEGLERAGHLPYATPTATPTGPAATPTGLAAISPHGGSLQLRLVPPELASVLAREATGLSAVELDAWALTDLELLAGGGLSPLTGFMGEADLLSVRDRMRLADGTVWSLPILLPVDAEAAREIKRGQRLALTHGSRPLGVLTVAEAFWYDPAELALKVYGTADVAHPGVARTLDQPGFAVAGPVDVIALPDGPFSELRLSPSQTRAQFRERGWRTIVGFQTRNPVHRAHEYLQKVALEQVDGLLLHPLVGQTKDDDIPASTRMRCYEALIQHHHPRDRVLLSVFPASMRYAGPREAIFHAIVRQNYGCTHFIVGRDHAGVGSYYGSYDAQEIFDRFAPGEIGIQPLKFEHAFYCRACGQMATSRTCPHASAERVVLSGTRVREMLQQGDPLPVEFTRPEIAAILQDAQRQSVATT
jgi:ATP sulfurylase/adenylyl-sulfate kinase